MHAAYILKRCGFEEGRNHEKDAKRPWYRKPAWQVSIAAVLVALGWCCFSCCAAATKRSRRCPIIHRWRTPRRHPTRPPTPDPEPEPTPDPSQGSYTEGEQTDGVWNLVLVNPWNPLPEDFSVDIEPLDNAVALISAAIPSCKK